MSISFPAALQCVQQKLVQDVKEQGCSSIELLYVALVDWYQKVGFQVNQRQWMGEKIL